jgi:hypothetical protein
MRVCAKMRCGADPAATVSLVYITREVVVADLAPEHDPELLELCAEHVARMAPPRGWTVRDERSLVHAVAE